MIKDTLKPDATFVPLYKFKFDKPAQTLTIAWQDCFPKDATVHTTYLQIDSHVTGKVYVFNEEEFTVGPGFKRVTYQPTEEDCPVHHVHVFKKEPF